MKQLRFSLCRLVWISYVLLPAILPAPALAQMPAHPQVSQDITDGRIPVPYVLEHLAELRDRGVDGAWRDPALESIQSKEPGTFSRTLGLASPPTGSWKALVILVDFSDKVSQVAATSFDALLFGTGTGTLPDYFRAVSYNALDIVTVHLPGNTGWKRAPSTYAYYVNAKNGLGTYPQNAQKLAEDAVTAVDPYVDFSKYDNNGDDYVDALFIVHAGPGAEYTGNSNDIWSHAWVTKSPQLRDGVYVWRYSMEPEYWQNPGDMTIGVYAHELGHAGFGVPDLYDRDYSSRGMGRWSLMASGSWNGTGPGGNYPALPDAWTHAQMGYVNPVNVTANVFGQQCRNIETYPDAFRLWTGGTTGNQYFLVENRQKTGYDTYLPGSGIMIYHVDQSVTTQNDKEWYPGNTTNGHYIVALEQGDGLWELEKKLNYGNSGDPYPGSTNNRTFSTNTTPDNRDCSSATTSVAVTNISSSAAVMSADLLIEVPVPIQLASFTALVRSSSTVLLEWGTISETNNYGFEVQRKRTDQEAFAALPGSFIPGHGTTLVPQHYSYIDTSVGQFTWLYRLQQIDMDGTLHYTDPVSAAVLTGVSDQTQPRAFVLEQNYPNPFNPMTKIQFTIVNPRLTHGAQTGGQGQLTIVKVSDVLGRDVATVVNEVKEPGTHTVQFDGSGLASGVYFYRLEAGNFVEVKKFLLLR